MLTYTDNPTVVVGHTRATVMLVGFYGLKRSAFIADLKPVAAHAICAGDEETPFVKDRCANYSGTAFAWSPPE
jgi:hypothetical protein